MSKQTTKQSINFAAILPEVAVIKGLEGAKLLDLRNEAARRLFASKKNRFVNRDDGTSVETWFDGQSRNYITITKDAEGNQLGDANTTGHKNDAAIAHAWALFAFLS